MTNRNKKREPARGFRETRPAAREPTPEEPRRRGVLDALFAARPPADIGMPRIRTALARGVAVVAGSPVLVVAPFLYVLALWLVMVAFGFQGPFAPFANALALPPMGTSFDATLATGLFGLQGGLLAILAFVALRSVVMAFLTTAIVDSLEAGRTSIWAVTRGVVALPTTLGVNIIGIGLLTLSSFFAPLLGPGFGILIQLATLVLGAYLFVYAPVIAVAERGTMPEALSKSVRAARIPGAGNLTMASLYVIPTVAVILAPGKPGNIIGVNPSIGAWVFVLLATFLQVVAMAAFAYRYLSIADEVPAAAPRQAPARGRGRPPARRGR